MIAARDRTHGGTSFDPERLARYERGLQIPLRVVETDAPPRLTEREAHESSVTSFSRGCRVICDLTALLIIACLFFGPPLMLAWVIVLLCFTS